MAKEKKSARPLDELDAATRKELNRILRKEPAALTVGEKEFLFGRRDYLTADQRKDYGVEKPVWREEAEEADENKK